MVEAGKKEVAPSGKFRLASEELVSRLKSSPKLHLSLLFLLLEVFIERRKFKFWDLRDFQVEGIRLAIRNKGIFLIAPTGSGKTLVAYLFLGKAVADGYVGVYLVPHTQLLDQKVAELYEFFRDYIHIIKMSGEFQPTQEELRKHRSHLIIVATYESFRAFLFEVQNREYFNTQTVFKGVVVDEIHLLGDAERGWKLESMLYKLQQDHKARFCCLSATFTKKDARIWSARLGCQLIYQNPFREFSYREVIKYKVKKQMTAAEQKVARKEKIELVLKECWKFIVDEHITNMRITNLDETASYEFLESDSIEDSTLEPQTRKPQVQDAKLLIFCYSRRFS